MELFLAVFCLLSIVIITIIFYWAATANSRKRESLMLKYGDSQVVSDIMEGCFWQGQTDEQLLDSLGKPVDTDQKILKSKTKEIWKYRPAGKNRYGLKIGL